MTVTFTMTSNITGYDIVCSCGNAVMGNFSTYDQARAALQHTKNTCDDDYCQAFNTQIDIVTDVDESLDVNVSNSNARFILDNLGQDTVDISGVLNATDFKGAVLMALAVAPSDDGVPSVTSGNLIDFGRAQGYLQHKLDRLHTLAEEAEKMNRNITWG